MIGTTPALLFDGVPWWIAAPILYLGLLCVGMALDETYVNRTTVLAGSLALAVHSLVTGGLWLPLSLYLDVGLVVGAYGLYAYVVDGYVGDWFRLLAYLLYSPLTIVLVLLFPDILFILALVIAGYANLQLLATLHPVEPYYFGPESPDEYADVASETGNPEPIERTDKEPGAGLSETVSAAAVTNAISERTATGDEGSSPGRSSVESPDDRPPGEEPSDRGVLPGFMRRV
ncbi:hypothetical protein [Halovivax gelatinilyticus]|uniref:hypothetical protein n=1 Tax=Halovivax gelatinilyticus TaxID=2961597 RepID=UPI0020CA5E09|nr:hypothetical protein [Halovivax gelatinilyticus]